jgi:microcystin-dependent protein
MLGEIVLLSFRQNLDGMIPCDGRDLLIKDYAPLFSLIGTTYGGNGVSTFKIPKIVDSPAPGSVWCIHTEDEYPPVEVIKK